MQEAKLKSWKMFWTINDGVNPWNIAYKIASGKVRNSTRLTTLEKDDATHTTDMKSTITHMLEHFIPEDREGNDNELHKKIRKKIQEPPDTADDKAFRKDEIIVNFKKFNSKKAPGEDGITHNILMGAFHVFPLFSHNYTMCVQRRDAFLKNGNIRL